MAGRRKATITDVARKAGVSVGSVSNVLNNSAGVSETLRARVVDAALALDFSLNSVAQTLRRRRSMRIGYCTSTIMTAYLQGLADALDAIVSENGYELVHVRSHQDSRQELRRVQSLIAQQIDGLILMPTLDPSQALEAASKAGVPLVIVDRLAQDPRFSQVILDNRAIAANLMELFLQQGHRSFLFVPQNLSVVTTRHRIEGFDRCMCANCGEVALSALEWIPDPVAFIDALRDHLTANPRPTAVITGNSTVALATVQGLGSLGLKVPGDLSLATFDDPEWATVVSPPLTTVRAPLDVVAGATWGALIAEMLEPETARDVHSISSQIVFRSSIGPIPCGSEGAKRSSAESSASVPD